MDAKDLMRQASMTASEYLDQAILRIDNELGAGYARNHPELIGAFMQAAATDYHAMWLGQILGNIANSLIEISVSIDTFTLTPSGEE